MDDPTVLIEAGQWFIFTNPHGHLTPALCIDPKWDTWDAPGVWYGVPPEGWERGPSLRDLLDFWNTRHGDP